MRLLVATLLVVASATAAARPRVQVTPFSVRGDALGYFGPEVGRAVAAALEGAGVETGPGAEVTLAGRLEELAGDRVRLSATLRGRTVSAEGPLEAVDAVATQLANKIAPLLLENDPAAQRAAERRAREAERRAAAVPASSSAPSAAHRAEPPPAAPDPTKPDDSVRPTTPAGVPPEAKSPPSEPTRAAERAGEPARPAPPGEARPEPPKGEAKPPEWVPPRVDTPPKVEAAAPRPSPETAPAAAPSSYPPPYYSGYVRGRVVAHVVADPPSAAYPSAGVMATQALFSFLHRRMRLSVIPTGVGITSVAVAADEAYRAAARAVVMSRLDSVEYLPGPSARVRLEVIVVRDGRPVMRRVVESAPSDPARRGAGTDPVFQAVAMALEALVPELVGALADVR